MSEITFAPGEMLLVAGRGAAATDGLHGWVRHGAKWTGTHLATVDELAVLAAHPNLPIVYGASGVGSEGQLHAWELKGMTARRIGQVPSQGYSPCHIAVDPEGRCLVVTNYKTSTLGMQALGADGSFSGELELVTLTGGGPDADRQDGAHPHQALFVGDTLFVIDLGADLLREFDFDTGATDSTLRPKRETPLPPGTGPRHGVALPDGRFAISGELASTLAVGPPGCSADDWEICSSTKLSGPARTRSARNYPGDIRGSADGRFVYFANRGFDSISTFDISGATPQLVSERDSGVAWPQHLLVHGDHLLIAGWDSSQVVAMPLEGGIPGAAEPVLDCPGAGWLLFCDEGRALT